MDFSNEIINSIGAVAEIAGAFYGTLTKSGVPENAAIELTGRLIAKLIGK